MPIMTKVARIASGMDRPTMKVLRNERRNRITTNIDRSAPRMAASRTDLSASLMKPDWSYVTSLLMSGGT